MKTHHGTIVMWKTSIVLVIGLGFLLYGIFAYSDTSKTYWTNVGPTWNKLLNPDTHND